MKELGMITFPFMTALLAFLILAIMMVFFTYKINQQNGVLVKSKWVVFIEMFFDFFSNIVSSTIGEKNVKKFTPLAITMWLSIFIGNVLPLLGFQDAATDLMFPMTWSLSMFVFWNVYGIYKVGIGGFVKDFFTPVWWLFPLEIISFFTKPLTLLVRMFGNITSGFIMMGVFWSIPNILESLSGVLGYASLAIFVPVGGLLSFYFSIFSPFIQATVFTYLVLVNLGMIINEEE